MTTKIPLMVYLDSSFSLPFSRKEEEKKFTPDFQPPKSGEKMLCQRIFL